MLPVEKSALKELLYILFSVLDQKNNAILELRKLHEEYVEQKRVEHAGAMEHLRYQHRDDINSLQKKQEYQMEGKAETFELCFDKRGLYASLQCIISRKSSQRNDLLNL